MKTGNKHVIMQLLWYMNDFRNNVKCTQTYLQVFYIQC